MIDLTKPHSVLFLNAKSDTTEMIAGIKAKLRALMPMSKIVTGFEDFQERCNGTWAGWTVAVATGLKYGSQEPLYTVYICPNVVIGKATADIIGLVLNTTNKSVYHFDGQKLFRVTKVDELPNSSYIYHSTLTLE